MLSARKEFSFYLWVMLDIGHCLMENLKWFWVENKECSIDFFLSFGLEWALKLNEKVPSYMKLKRNFERFSREILNWLLNNDRKMLKLNVFVKCFVIFCAISLLCKCSSIHQSYKAIDYSSILIVLHAQFNSNQYIDIEY